MAKNLDEAIASAGNPAALLWNSRSRTALAPRIPLEFSNWRSEQLAWRNSAILFTQSHHMADLGVRDRDAAKLVAEVGVNRTDNFDVGTAKQFVAVNARGELIGDNIMLRVADDEIHFVGIPTTINWLQYNVETGGYDVDVVRDDDSTVRPGDP